MKLDDMQCCTFLDRHGYPMLATQAPEIASSVSIFGVGFKRLDIGDGRTFAVIQKPNVTDTVMESLFWKAADQDFKGIVKITCTRSHLQF